MPKYQVHVRVAFDEIVDVVAPNEKLAKVYAVEEAEELLEFTDFEAVVMGVDEEEPSE